MISDLCRHLLQELTVSSYVPNDTLLMSGSAGPEDASISPSVDQPPNMLLLTGPNYSGKSVYMKQVRHCLQIKIFSPSYDARLRSSSILLS